MNIQEDFVSLETAKLLKEKGFNEPCRLYYDKYHGCVPIFVEDSKLTEYGYKELVRNDQNSISDFIATAPSLYVAMKWLREVHHYIIEIHYGNVGSPREPEMQWWWELENKQGEFLDGNITDGNTTYEEAAEAAIRYCLENLI